MAQEFDRFRSFAERYIIARAAEFEKDRELDDAWETLLKAKTIYNQISQMSRDVDKAENGTMPPGVQQATAAPNRAKPLGPHASAIAAVSQQANPPVLTPLNAPPHLVPGTVPHGFKGLIRSLIRKESTNGKAP